MAPVPDHDSYGVAADADRRCLSGAFAFPGRFNAVFATLSHGPVGS